MLLSFLSQVVRAQRTMSACMDNLSNLTCSRVHSLGQCTSPAAKWDCSQKCSGELGRCNSHDALRARVFVTGVHGLGNNLFQIAVAIWYAETYGHRVVLQRDDQLLLTGTANMRPYCGSSRGSPFRLTLHSSCRGVHGKKTVAHRRPTDRPRASAGEDTVYGLGKVWVKSGKKVSLRLT